MIVNATAATRRLSVVIPFSEVSEVFAIESYIGTS